MLNLNDDNAFLGDVSFSVYSLMCKYCEATEDKNPKCQIPLMKVMHFMGDVNSSLRNLICRYCKKQKITFLNVKT